MLKSDSVDLEVFVASPGDVSREREMVREIGAELESTIRPIFRLNIRPYLWEHDLGPGADTGGPQGLVDAQSTLTTCDILVGIFWNRFGTPTPDGTTGTEHEFKRSYQRWQSTGKPHLMLYFCQRKIEQTSKTLEQANLLLKFKEALPKDVLTWKYGTPQSFERVFRQHLTQYALRLWSERGARSGPVHFVGPDLKLGMTVSADELIRANMAVVNEAEEVFFATGSRSRDEAYLKRIESRLKEAPRLVHYRVLMGLPFRKLLKEHLLRLLAVRSPADRTLGFQSLYLGIYERPLQQAEVFIAGNEKRVLVVLPSRKGVGEYNNALVIDDRGYVKDLQQFVKQLYVASRPIETPEAVGEMPTQLS